MQHIASIHIGKSLKAVTQAKTCQRVWLPQRTDEKEARAYNIVYSTCPAGHVPYT